MGLTLIGKNFAGVIAFMKVAATENLTSAARELNVTVPAISKSISRLEAQIGVRLLERTTHQVDLTHEGRFFYENCVSSVDHVMSTVEGLKGMTEANAGVITLLSPAAFGRKCVSPLIPKFAERYPDISIDFQLTDRSSDISEGFVDLAIQCDGTPDFDMTICKLANTRLLMCASPAYLARRSPPLTLPELFDHQIIGYRDPATSKTQGWQIHVDGTSSRIQVPQHLVVNDLEVLTTAVASGAGIAQLPDYQVADLLKSGALVALLPQATPQASAVYLCHKRRKKLPKRTQLFVDYLMSELSPTAKTNG